MRLCPVCQTAVAIVPLRFGAGVKGKVLEALSYGAPVVTTSVGIQGLQGAESFASIQDTAETFAGAVIETLRNPERMQAEVFAGLDFVARFFSQRSIQEVFAIAVPQLLQNRMARTEASDAHAR
jgi:glycosyltransferase involved in cell wall biosynthesis